MALLSNHRVFVSNCRHFLLYIYNLIYILYYIYIKWSKAMNSNPALTIIVLNLWVWPTFLTGNSALSSIESRLDLQSVLRLPFLMPRCQLSILPLPFHNLRLTGGGKTRMNHRSMAPEGPWAEIGGKVTLHPL